MRFIYKSIPKDSPAPEHPKTVADSGTDSKLNEILKQFYILIINLSLIIIKSQLKLFGQQLIALRSLQSMEN